MTAAVRLLIAQINPIVGHLDYNTQCILEIIQAHSATHDIILFPELALTGYPPEDLLFQPDFFEKMSVCLSCIQQATANCHVILGHPQRVSHQCFNTASIFYKKKQLAHYHKQALPNDSVFDERRYFVPGAPCACILTVNTLRLGVCICEDIWTPAPMQQLFRANVAGVLCLNASPFDRQKYQKRLETLQPLAQKGVFIAYANLVGGQDELLFDGGSLVLDASGTVMARAPIFETALLSVTLPPAPALCSPLLSEEALLYKGLVLSIRDYFHKNKLVGALVGLSGGIDSALTLALAVDALGADNVTAVKLPSSYTQAMSHEDADFEIQALGVSAHTLSIQPAFHTLLHTLKPIFENHPPTLPEENLQARLRAILLMALSNQTGKLVLTTSNKSEIAVGYSTLYGDMAGGFNVLKDVYKTQVYALARARNAQSLVIPERVFTRAPSAELAPHQTDQDTLPPYDRLDRLLKAYIEDHATPQQLVAQGFDETEVTHILQRIRYNEYKRSQGPIGPKISPRAFGRDWRMPVTNGFTSPFTG